jgi:hypothetical protein
MKKSLISFMLLLGFVSCAACSTEPRTYAIALGDLDHDGDLDAYLANGKNEGGVKDTVWFNDGRGNFTRSLTQSFEMEKPFVALGDLDGDGDLDAMLGGGAGVPAFNDGQGNFTYPRPFIYVDDSGAWFFYPALGDLDGDGDLDVALGGCCGGKIDPTPTGETGVLYSFNMVWFNDGRGKFTDSGQRLGVFGTGGVALGDLDSDGDLDIFDANSGSIVEGTQETAGDQPDVVWLNDGHGSFTDSGQRLGREQGYAVALGDLDLDGDLDAFVGNRQADTIWINDGSARFADSGQMLGNSGTGMVNLNDLDGDGDLDACTSDRGYVDTWINQGGAQAGQVGTFQHAQHIEYSIWHASTLADVDADGDPDLFAALLDRDIRLWLNDGNGRFVEK